MKSETTKCSNCIYARWIWIGNDLWDFRCLCIDDCGFKKKETWISEVGFEGEKLLVRQSNYYHIPEGELVDLTVYRGDGTTDPRNEVLSVPDCPRFLDGSEVLGLLKSKETKE